MLEKIASEEGYEQFLYKCTGDKWSIGYGFNLEDAGIPEPVARFWLKSFLSDLSNKIDLRDINILALIINRRGFIQFLAEEDGVKKIGYHSKLDAGIPEHVAKYWLNYNINHLQAKLHGFDFYENLDHDRQTVLVDMAYQMGIEGLLRFKDMINAIKRKDWDAAADAMLDSKYAKIDSPNRAKRNAETMRTGKILLNR